MMLWYIPSEIFKVSSKLHTILSNATFSYISPETIIPLFFVLLSYTLLRHDEDYDDDDG